MQYRGSFFEEGLVHIDVGQLTGKWELSEHSHPGVPLQRRKAERRVAPRHRGKFGGMCSCKLRDVQLL